MKNGHDDPRPTIEPFADAERFTVDEDGDPQTLVVLAKATLEGHDYALLADESDLESEGTDMGVFVYEVIRNGMIRDLKEIGDEAKEDEIYAYFADLMGLEEDDEDEAPES
jgi:hypothetical protein